jgi:hypothetical protein
LTAVCLSLAAAGELQLLFAPLAISARVSSSLGDGATLFGSSESLSSVFLLRLFWGDRVEVGGSMIHGACRCASNAASRMDSGSYTADELRIADQVVLIFLSLGCIRRRQLRSSPMSLSRFSEEEPSVLSSVLLPRYLQLNLKPCWCLPSRLLVEPLALRLARLLEVFEVHGCRFTLSVFSTTPWQAQAVFFLLRRRLPVFFNRKVPKDPNHCH